MAKIEQYQGGLTEERMQKMNKRRNKLRLILFDECHRNCVGCCNKDWDIRNLPVCNDFRGFDLIMLTGGEPMLHPNVILQTIEIIRSQTKAPIILYTALLEDKVMLGKVLDLIEGITITLHEPEDIGAFMEFDRYYPERTNKSFRINLFKGVEAAECSPRWKIKDDIVWIKNSPLPDGERLMRLSCSL